MRWLRLCSLFLLVLSGQAVFAQEIVLDGFAGIGSRAMGMGGAFVSVGDDYSSAFWNPAGLARASRGTVYWEATHGRFENESRFFGSPAKYALSSTRICAIGVVIPYPVHQGSLVFAGGFGRNKNFDNGLEISGYDTAVDYDKKGFSEDRGALGAWTLSGAVDMAPNLSVGLSLYRWRGSNQFDQELTLTDVQNAHSDTVRFYQRYASKDRYSAWGIQGGLLYWHRSGFRMGLTVAATTPLRVASQLEDEFEDEYDNGTDVYPTERYSDQYKIEHPLTFALGMGFVRGPWTVAGDVHYGDLQAVTYDQLPQVLAPNVDDFRRQYRDALRLHLGGEYAFRNLAFRAGYYRDPVRYVGGGNVPNIAIENDRNAWTLGVGGKLENTVGLDVAAVLGGYRVVEGNRADRVKTVRVFASATFWFDMNDDGM
jgi:long-subunit fatty acid transport protein